MDNHFYNLQLRFSTDENNFLSCHFFITIPFLIEKKLYLLELCYESSLGENYYAESWINEEKIKPNELVEYFSDVSDKLTISKTFQHDTESEMYLNISTNINDMLNIDIKKIKEVSQHFRRKQKMTIILQQQKEYCFDFLKFVDYIKKDLESFDSFKKLFDDSICFDIFYKKLNFFSLDSKIQIDESNINVNHRSKI